MTRLIFSYVLLLAVSLALPTATTAQTAQQNKNGQNVPRFVSLRSGEVNVRAGPGVRYPIKWVFVRKNLPVEITAEFETWRKIRDSEGAEGWVHRAMLTSKRSVIVGDKTVTVRRLPKNDAPAVARLAPGMVALIEGCDASWCEINARGYEGWVPRVGIWGLYPGEQPK